jgi:branched-chain amino acid aminotransferase
MSATWFNGAIVEGAIAIDPRDRGLTLGDGLFETIAVLNSCAIWLDDHVARIKLSADELGIGFDEERLRAGVAEVLQRHSFASARSLVLVRRQVC